MAPLGAAAQEEPTAWGRLQDPRPLPAIGSGAEPTPLPAEGREEWARGREDAGLGVDPIGIAEPNAVAAALPVLAADGWLVWERALLAAAVDVGVMDGWAASHWAAVLDAAATSDPPTLRRTALHTALLVGGAPAALLPATCLGDQLPALGALDGGPWRVRARSTTEGPVTCSEDDPVARATCAFARVASEQVRPARPWSDDPCGVSLVEAAAGWAATRRADWPSVSDGLRALHETHTVPSAFAHAAAVAWYLDTHAAGLEALARAQAATGAHPRDVSALFALAAGARNEPRAMQEAVRGVELSGDSFSLWVAAEVARRAGDTEVALRRADAALERDPLFAAALLTRASVLIAAGRSDEAIADFEYLRRVFDAASPYAGWIGALGRALR